MRKNILDFERPTKRAEFYDASLLPQGETCTPIYDLGHAYPMKTAVRLGAISPITG